MTDDKKSANARGGGKKSQNEFVEAKLFPVRSRKEMSRYLDA